MSRPSMIHTTNGNAELTRNHVGSRTTIVLIIDFPEAILPRGFRNQERMNTCTGIKRIPRNTKPEFDIRFLNGHKTGLGKRASFMADWIPSAVGLVSQYHTHSAGTQVEVFSASQTFISSMYDVLASSCLVRRFPSHDRFPDKQRALRLSITEHTTSKRADNYSHQVSPTRLR